MNSRLTKQIWDRFPDLFTRQVHVDVGDGWYTIVWNMCHQLQEELEKTPNGHFQFIQVKEKFGLLRVYAMCNIAGYDKILSEAEDKSAECCELCGQTGRLVRSITKWFFTRCPEHTRPDDEVVTEEI